MEAHPPELNSLQSGENVVLRFTTNPGPAGNTGWDWAVWGEPKIVVDPVDTPINVGFFLPTEPTKRFPKDIRSVGQGQYFLETTLPAQILFFFEPVGQAVSPHNLREVEFIAGLEFDGIFRLGNAWNSGDRRIADSGDVRKETIFAHPPHDGETILQFYLLCLKLRLRHSLFQWAWGKGVVKVMECFSKYY